MSEAMQQDGKVVLNILALKHLRRELCLSQDALADLSRQSRNGVSSASIKRAERGEPVLYRTARNLASALGVTVRELLKGSDA